LTSEFPFAFLYKYIYLFLFVRALRSLFFVSLFQLDSLRADPEMQQTRSKISAAASRVSKLKADLLSHSSSVAHQNEIALLQILTPSQSIRFLEWFLRNKNRCAALISKSDRVSNAYFESGSLPKANSDHSLNDFCQQLTDTRVEG